ncbi:hypothetical protein DL764_010935 [Monosporascus ibericus]|uniref:RING-CH-type domain-containing protein n=1 Tax=Monosporascus ibericus TaxID=155417 RepID=A0A4Q4SU72_9PEZI|nr:hypothetical protein DL764_010935 [Monosporascus ibericus]
MDGQQSWNFAGLNTDEPPGSSPNVKETREENSDYRREADPELSFQNTRPRSDEMPNRARKCWICLDEELPEYVSTGLLGRRRRKIYRSEDPALGRLICPCRCRGSIKYVHEGCIKQWRNQNPEAYRCGRCGYHYQLERLTWAERLRSPLLAMAITISILITTIFLLGFVADPILGLWIDPVGTIAETVGSGSLTPEEKIELLELEEQGWTEHFVKGLFSLGLLGFAKAFLAMSPWQWWNLRTSGIIGGTRRGGTGRDRIENISVTLVLIGVITFLWAVWKGTRSWTERTLDRASERIMNAHRDDESDSDDDDDNQERRRE